MFSLSTEPWGSFQDFKYAIFKIKILLDLSRGSIFKPVHEMTLNLVVCWKSQNLFFSQTWECIIMITFEPFPHSSIILFVYISWCFPSKAFIPVFPKGEQFVWAENYFHGPCEERALPCYFVISSNKGLCCKIEELIMVLFSLQSFLNHHVV